MKTERAVLHGGDAGILNGDERKICGDRRGKMQRGFRTQIVGHALQPLKKIQPQQAKSANERKDDDGQDDRRAFDGLERHAMELN